MNVNKGLKTNGWFFFNITGNEPVCFMSRLERSINYAMKGDKKTHPSFQSEVSSILYPHTPEHIILTSILASRHEGHQFNPSDVDKRTFHFLDLFSSLYFRSCFRTKTKCPYNVSKDGDASRWTNISMTFSN